MQDLSDNNAGPSLAFSVAEMTATNSTLSHLSLRGKLAYSNISDDISILIHYLIAGNRFNDKAAEPLAGILKV